MLPARTSERRRGRTTGEAAAPTRPPPARPALRDERAPTTAEIHPARRWGRLLRAPLRYWRRQSLRARLTLLATAVFALAVTTGAILVIELQRIALMRVLDSSAVKTANTIKKQLRTHPGGMTVQQPTGGVTSVQVLGPDDSVLATSPGADRYLSALSPAQLEDVREGQRFDIAGPATGTRLRVLGVRVGARTVVVFTDLSRVDDSVRVLTRAALVGAPLAVLLLGLLTYAVVALTLRPVAGLRTSAANISRNAAGAPSLTGQRLPVPAARDEIQRLALTLNAMLDRIESATARQRTFVGDAAHELRSPLASLRVQLEVAQRLGPDTDWRGLIDDVLIDVSRLDRLVEDLLSLARLDELGAAARREDVAVAELAETVVSRYGHARVPVTLGEHVTQPAVREATVCGDADALRRVLVNLVDNAVRYAASEVVVDVEIDATPTKRSAAGRLVLTVTDDGPGLPPHERERVFDRFYRAEFSRSRDSGGTGLGLPIVRDLVRSHRGSVRLRERPDDASGLQAVVALPLGTPG